jgi:hypothetical protein
MEGFGDDEFGTQPSATGYDAAGFDSAEQTHQPDQSYVNPYEDPTFGASSHSPSYDNTTFSAEDFGGAAPPAEFDASYGGAPADFLGGSDESSVSISFFFQTSSKYYVCCRFFLLFHSLANLIFVVVCKRLACANWKLVRLLCP